VTRLDPRPSLPSGTNPAAADLLTAASLTLALLTAAKVPTVDDLTAGAIPADIHLTPAQRDQILANSHPLHWLRVAAGSGLTPGTLAVCTRCGTWQVVTGTKAPARCVLRTGCEGAVVRALKADRFTTAARSFALPGVSNG
jgi:hypothetical protein